MNAINTSTARTAPMVDLPADMEPLGWYELASGQDAFYGGLITEFGQDGPPHLQHPQNPDADPRFVYGILDNVGLATWKVREAHGYRDHDTGELLATSPDSVY